MKNWEFFYGNNFPRRIPKRYSLFWFLSHWVRLIQTRGYFWWQSERFFQKQINSFNKNKRSMQLVDVQLTRHLKCRTFHKIKQFHLSDVLLVQQPKKLTYIFSDLLIKSFDSICPTLLVSLRSSKQN